MSPCTVLVELELGDHVAGQLLAGNRVRDQILETGVDAFERRGLRIGDVAGDVLQRKRLRPHSRHRRGESTENTHDLFSTMVRADARNGPQTRSLGETIAIPMPWKLCNYFNGLKENGGPPGAAAPVFSAVKRQILPTSTIPGRTLEPGTG